MMSSIRQLYAEVPPLSKSPHGARRRPPTSPHGGMAKTPSVLGKIAAFHLGMPEVTRGDKLAAAVWCVCALGTLAVLLGILR
jgi:hypothetical protein